MMNPFPPPESLILIAVMPSSRDMELARLLGWYRIPLRSAPKVVNVDYLAFYQTDDFGEQHRWRIEYFAKVMGHELTTRAQLLRDQVNHPRANEEYFKIQIGSLSRLEHPILADRWKRITFLYTTGELFRDARTVNDLVVRSDERQLLWRSLRERSGSGQTYQAMDLPEDSFQIDPELLKYLILLTDPSQAAQPDTDA